MSVAVRRLQRVLKGETPFPLSLDFLDFLRLYRLRTRRVRSMKMGSRHHNVELMFVNKLFFNAILRGNGLPTPENVAYMSRNGALVLATLEHVSLVDFMNVFNNASLFVKPNMGGGGVGGFKLSIHDCKPFVNRIQLTKDQFIDLMPSLKSYRHGCGLLAEDLIVQHSDMSRLHPHSINTVRLLTVVIGHKISVFRAVLRIGTSARSVDNWASGGVIINIDTACGTTKGDGCIKTPRSRVTKHPDTSCPTDGIAIPFWDQACRLVLKAHSLFPFVPTIGWDVGLTPTGPILIEANTDWDAHLHRAFEEDFDRSILDVVG
jgi:hypothetical protein